MKRVLIVLTAGLLAGLLGAQPKAFAQGGQVEISSEGAPSSDLPVAELQAFDQFRADHPEIVHALSHNPKLVNSRSFQARNPALRDYMSAHSGFEAAFAENPGNFIPPTRGMGAAHHRRHKAAKESTAKEGAASAPAAAMSPAGAPAAEGGAPETSGSPAGGSGAGGGGGN